MSHRYKDIDFIRCVSNYMIILLHASATNQYCNLNSIEYSIWNFIYTDVCSAALPVLFMISGFLMFRNYTIDNLSNKLKRRVGRLVVPYFSWNIIFVIIYIIGAFIVPRLAIRVNGFQLMTFSGIADKVFSLIWPPIDGPLWFIRALFIYSLLSPLLYMFLKNITLRIIFIISVVCIGLYCVVTGISPILNLSYPPYSLIMFFIGGIISKSSSSPLEIFNGKKIMFLGIMGITVLFFIGNCYASPIINELITIIKYFMKALIFFSFISFIDISAINRVQIYTKLREMSFFAYAGHFLFCSILIHLIAPYITFIEFGKQTILTLIFFIGGIGIMWPIFFISRIICPNILKLFDGNLKL